MLGVCFRSQSLFVGIGTVARDLLQRYVFFPSKKTLRTKAYEFFLVIVKDRFFHHSSSSPNISCCSPLGSPVHGVFFIILKSLLGGASMPLPASNSPAALAWVSSTPMIVFENSRTIKPVTP